MNVPHGTCAEESCRRERYQMNIYTIRRKWDRNIDLVTFPLTPASREAGDSAPHTAIKTGVNISSE